MLRTALAGLRAAGTYRVTQEKGHYVRQGRPDLCTSVGGAPAQIRCHARCTWLLTESDEARRFVTTIIVTFARL
jgi:hypothetical protein